MVVEPGVTGLPLAYPRDTTCRWRNCVSRGYAKGQACYSGFDDHGRLPHPGLYGCIGV